MNSAFVDVAPDRLRYSLVWEDSHTLYEALDLQPDDRALVITSAGCNALNILLKTRATVTAIDLNPVQNNLLLLKKHVILHHDYRVFFWFMGFNGPSGTMSAWREVRKTLPVEQLRYWTPFFTYRPGIRMVMNRSSFLVNRSDGLLTDGKLETYIRDFRATLDYAMQKKLWQLIGFTNVERQRDFFLNEFDNSPFKVRFIDYFDEANLSKGRDPALFTYAPESGGAAFYNRLLQQVSTVLVRNNFFLTFFLFGPQTTRQHVWPPCYQKANYSALRAALNRLTVVDGEAIDYLLSAEGQTINKASLSNIFEYASRDEFRRVCQLLHERGHPLRFVFWNLLQEQGAFLEEDGWHNVPIRGQASPTSCFYFRSVRAVKNDE